jgi:hypothetical protein
VPVQVIVGTTTSIRARSRDWTSTGTFVFALPTESSSMYIPESPLGAVNVSRGTFDVPWRTARPVPIRRSCQRYGRPRASTNTFTFLPAVTGFAGGTAAIARIVNAGTPRDSPRSGGTRRGVTPSLPARSRAITWTR